MYYLVTIQANIIYPDTPLRLLLSPIHKPNTHALLPLQERWRDGPTLLCHRNVGNRPHRYLLGHGVLDMSNIEANYLQTCVYQRFYNRGVLPSSVPQPLRNPSIDPDCRLNMENPHRPKYVWHYKTLLWTKNQDILHHCNVEPPKRPRVFPLMYKYVV